MLPPFEVLLLQKCVADARACAQRGRYDEGRAILDAGLVWAETPPIDPVTWQSDPPEPWAEELTALYRAALMAYVDTYHERLAVSAVERLIPD